MFTALGEFYFVSGTSTIRSEGYFKLEGQKNSVRISGTVKHHWYDTYDWHLKSGALVPGFGIIQDSDALLMQKYRGAKTFEMESDWEQKVSGIYINGGWKAGFYRYSWSGP